MGMFSQPSSSTADFPWEVHLVSGGGREGAKDGWWPVNGRVVVTTSFCECTWKEREGIAADSLVLWRAVALL